MGINWKTKLYRHKLVSSKRINIKIENIISSFITDEMGLNIKTTPKILELIIPNLVLRGGQYSIRLLAMSGDTQKENFLDEIENAFTLNVLRNHQGVIIESKMNII